VSDVRPFCQLGKYSAWLRLSDHAKCEFTAGVQEFSKPLAAKSKF